MLSDGSAFTLRTTSPLPVYRSTRDTRNAALWNPNSRDLQNVEDDEAGRLRAFRGRYGAGFDAAPVAGGREEAAEGGDRKEGDASATGAGTRKGGKAEKDEMMEGLLEEEEEGFATEEDANLMDLISSYNVEDANKGQPWQLMKEKRDRGNNKK